MTLSNFDWTDKDSVKWFVLMPEGHSGPFSLNQLIDSYSKKKLPSNVKVWVEGLPEGIFLKKIIEGDVQDTLPPLPPLPDEELPPLPVMEEAVEEIPPKKSINRAWIVVAILFGLMLYFIAAGLKSFGKFELRRVPKMTLELHQRILKENSFSGWDKKIFFKEYLPQDHSSIWLVTSSFHECEVEATFHSVKDKLLSMGDEKISFKSKGHLQGHLVEFSAFDYIEGTKITPGLYEMDVKATDCAWDGIKTKVANIFSPVEEEYMARMKVVLFSSGAAEFNKILDTLVQKKLEMAEKEKNEAEFFWQSLQQKLETLQAITLQVEQHMLDFLDKNPSQFGPNLKVMVNQYTKNFGSFLTSFVVENEKYFREIPPGALGISAKRDYELMVRVTSKNIGLESMKFIEEFQGIKKKITKKDLEKYAERIRQTYAVLKNDISQKIIQVSEDRSL